VVELSIRSESSNRHDFRQKTNCIRINRDPGHRWLNALGPYSDNQAVLEITVTSGGIFDTPTETTEVHDGTIILTFNDCESGTIEYAIPSIDRQGIVPIKRVVGDNIALCEELNSD